MKEYLSTSEEVLSSLESTQMGLTEDEAKQWAMNNLGDDGYKDMYQRIAEKPVPVIKEKRQYTHREYSHTGRSRDDHRFDQIESLRLSN